MSRVTVLIETVRSLPSKAHRVGMVSRLIAIRDALTDAKMRLTEGVSGMQFVDELSGKPHSEKMRTRLERISKDAGELSKFIRQDKIGAQSRRDDALTTAIREACVRISSDVRAIWREFV